MNYLMLIQDSLKQYVAAIHFLSKENPSVQNLLHAHHVICYMIKVFLLYRLEERFQNVRLLSFPTILIYVLGNLAIPPCLIQP